MNNSDLCLLLAKIFENKIFENKIFENKYEPQQEEVEVEVPLSPQ